MLMRFVCFPLDIMFSHLQKNIWLLISQLIFFYWFGNFEKIIRNDSNPWNKANKKKIYYKHCGIFFFIRYNDQISTYIFYYKLCLFFIMTCKNNGPVTKRYLLYYQFVYTFHLWFFICVIAQKYIFW